MAFDDTTSRPNPIPKPNALIAFVGNALALTPAALEMLNLWRGNTLGNSRTIPCQVGGSADSIVLTPRAPACTIEGYADHDAYAFVAAATSTGPVVCTVFTPPDQGGNPLPTLKVFKSNGAAQAVAGDITSGCFYLLYFVHSLDNNNGGFVIK